MEWLKYVLALIFYIGIASGSSAKVKNQGVAKIVGGNAITVQEVPYQIQLEYNGYPICGASIVDRFFALTTASCADGFNQRELTLRAGTSRHGSGGHIYQVYRINMHPLYDDYMKDYDVAVLELATPFRYDETTQPVNITDREPAAADVVRATGWGRTSEEGSESGQLLSVDIPVVARLECTEIYAGDVTTRMICAGVEGRDACRGDTGGPLVQNGVQVGITSWGYGCAEDGYPGVYTNLANVEISRFITSVVAGGI